MGIVFTEVQRAFIEEVAPYWELAKGEGVEEAFFERYFNLWFIRWPLNLRDYFDVDFMEDRRCLWKKVRKSSSQIHSFHP